jgi:hypothetical protein
MNSLEGFVKFIPSTNSASLSVGTNVASPSSQAILTDMELKARKLSSSLTDALYEVSNEPSLGFYR